MNTVVKEEWIKRLRSGKYTQTTGYLKINGGHCCLGVLCEIAAEQNVVKEENNVFGEFSLFDGNTGMPNNKVCDWAGIIYDDAEALAQMNDYGSTFDEIANAIETENYGMEGL